MDARELGIVKQIASVPKVARFQGYLLKKKKLFRFKEVYVVLQKGQLIYYNNE